ncbi:MAG TPA: hypothetical protein VFA05_07195 [Gaiellaceae bacterium]|nr:hypothetical protein [Gaiellaceae bacterium]
MVSRVFAGRRVDLRRARAAAAWLEHARPLPLLAALVAAQFCVTAWLAFRTPHNAWVWYSGGDATEYWTSQWSVAHGLMPQAYIGWGLSVFYAWIPLVTGTTLLTGLPVVVLLHALVLAPLALVLVWALAARLYGRRYAWAAAAVWVVGPPAAAALFAAHYRPLFEQAVLAPHWAGLTDMADFPSLVALLATAWATVRAIQVGRAGSAVAAGVLGGIMIGLKPSNGFFVLAAIVAFAVWWRPRLALAWAVGCAPAVVTLIVWKQRGRGTLPILSGYTPVRSAAGRVVGAISPGRYLPLDLHHLSVEWSELGQVFWDTRLLQFVFVAGAVGLLRRNVRWGLFVVVWFVAYCFLKGSSNQADVTTTSYFRLTLPGIAALALFVPAIGYLWPGVRPAASAAAPESPRIRWRSPAAAVLVVVALVPLAVVSAIRQPRRPVYARDLIAGTEAPISTALAPRAEPAGATVRLSWRPLRATAGAAVAYAVFRSSGGDGCTISTPGARTCQLELPVLASTTSTSFVDRPRKGTVYYRVAAVANYLKQANSTDLMLLSTPVRVSVR